VFPLSSNTIGTDSSRRLSPILLILAGSLRTGNTITAMKSYTTYSTFGLTNLASVVKDR